MAYATKYLFKWQSANGTTREIRVLKNGYSGSVLQRHLGRAPILKKQKNGTVFGTSLEFYAECQVDGEFAEFYTTNPKAYKVELYAGSTLLWTGYVTPELYSEPDIAPPYDVQVIATDGIGELKLYDFEAQGTKTLRQMFTYLLYETGLGTDVYLISSLKAGSSGAGALLEKTINLDYMVGKNCYEVLTYLLDTLHATITWWKGAWIVARETNVTFQNGKVKYFNTAGNAAQLAGSVVTLGKMYTNDAWPVGQLTQKVDPAKKSVTVQAPWHTVQGLQNSEMTSDTAWTKVSQAAYLSDPGCYSLPFVGYPTFQLPCIYQSVALSGMRVPMSFECRCTGLNAVTLGDQGSFNGALGFLITYQVGNTVYWLRKGDDGPYWEAGDTVNPSTDAYGEFARNLTTCNVDRINAEKLSLDGIPAFEQSGSYPSGTLTVYISGWNCYVYGASLNVVLVKGYQDRLHLDNGARGEGDTVEIAIGRETSDIDHYKSFLQGILLDSGALITSFKDDYLTSGTDFLSFISRDYARSFALPRIVRSGTVSLESAVAFPPLVFTKGAVDYWLDTWSWNMYEDELDISARSLPTASITVDSEVITESAGSTSSSSSSSGGASSSVGGGGNNYFEHDPNHDSGIALKTLYESLAVPDLYIGDSGESLLADLNVIGPALQSLQAQIDAVASRDCFDELTATAAFIDTLATDRVYANRYYFTDDIYFYIDVVDGTPCVHLNADFITDGDQILGDGTPGGGGGGGVTYFSELQDVSAAIAEMTSQQLSNKMLIWDTAATPVGGSSPTGAWSVIDKSSVGITTDATQNLHGLMSAADKTKLDGINTTYIANGETAYEALNVIGPALQSLQAQLDSVASRDAFDELTATAAFVDVLAAGMAVMEDLELAGHSMKSIPNDYIANPSITINGTATALGGSFATANITAGTAGTSSATSGASFSIPYVTMNKYGVVTGYGTHTHTISQANLFGSSAIGSAALPVYYNGSALASCDGSSIFSALSSGAATNLSATIAGQTRTATLYATYDSASENISDKFGIGGSALQSLQAQVDAVASRVDLSDYEATTEAKMDYICGLLGSLQAQIDSVSTRIDDGGYGYFDMLAVGGDIYCDYVFTTGDQVLSDERKKNITREIVLSAEQIASCRAVAFDWKDKPGSNFGSIAQDWQRILPESVRENADTLYLAYEQSAMVAVINLAREVVELRKQLEQRGGN